ncbi:Peroxin-3-domain-containing protein [Amanita rubescens]|nr:Peroxin-3-domain-containing protein [Amanita rubescens]
MKLSLRALTFFVLGASVMASPVPALITATSVQGPWTREDNHGQSFDIRGGTINILSGITEGQLPPNSHWVQHANGKRLQIGSVNGNTVQGVGIMTVHRETIISGNNHISLHVTPFRLPNVLFIHPYEPIDDHTRVKDVFMLRVLTDAPQELAHLFDYQLIVLNSIRMDDEDSEEAELESNHTSVEAVEWVRHSNPSDAANLICIYMGPKGRSNKRVMVALAAPQATGKLGNDETNAPVPIPSAAVLAWSKYVNSVLDVEREERLQEQLESELSLPNLLLSHSTKMIQDLLSVDLSMLEDEAEKGELEGDMITEEVERKFLTLSWWILHVGWKDVGERVRRGVEEVFEGFNMRSPLKGMGEESSRRLPDYRACLTTLAIRITLLPFCLPIHLNPTGAHNHAHHRNGIDQDADACIDCASISYLPPHPETHPHPMLKHVQDPPFVSLVEETRAVITSPDFEYVLEACLDSATSVLFEGLEKSVFVASEDAPGEEVRIRLAGLLPGLAKWSRLALRGLPNELVDSLLVLREVPCLSAIVFSKFEEKVKVL